MDEQAINKLIEEKIKKMLDFTTRKTTDTPTDALQVVPRKYVTLNGPSSNRPVSSVIGQRYFDTSLAAGNGRPVWWNGTGFVDADGSYV